MALSYPFVFNYPADKQFMPLIVDFIEDNLRQSTGDGSREGKAGKHTKSTPQNSARQIAEKVNQRTEPVPVLRETSTAALASSDTPTGIETAVSGLVPTNAGSSISLPLTNGSGGGGAGGDVGGASSGRGISGTGSGSGTGRSDGVGESKFVQASYAYSPKPEYPAPARREGKEGRVLLRVLVDEQGKSKSVEVDNSSGSEALDRAAAEVIKRWRFSPARDGNKSVESWVKIPIDFRLTDAQN